MKNVVHVFNLINKKLNILELERILNDISSSKLNIEILDDELDEVNRMIEDNDIVSFEKFVNAKCKLAKEIMDDMILEKTNNDLWQFIMDRAYEKWDKELSREEFLNLLTPYEKISVQLGNFNYQIGNGGMSQWDLNCYSSDIDDIESFVENCDFENKHIILTMITNFRGIKESIDNLDRYDDWYDEDYNTRAKHLDDYDKDYYAINKAWMEYINLYLLNKMPEEYLEMVINYEVSKPDM